MTVAGDLALQPGSTYNVQLAGTSASRADVSGIALLGGTLVATSGPGSSLTRSYDILHANDGFGGTRFAGLNNDPPNFLESLSYGPNDVTLDLTAALGAGVLLPANQQSVANALNGYFNAGGLLPGNFVDLYGLTGTRLSNALASVSGEVATGAQQTSFRSMDEFIETMLDPALAGRITTTDVGPPAPSPASDPSLPTRKASPVIGPLWSSWAAAFGGSGRLDGDPTGTGSHDFFSTTSAIGAGLDYHLSRDTLLGVALAGGQTAWGLSQGLGGGESNLLAAGIYASTRTGPTYLSGALAFSNQWMSTSRSAAFGDTLSSSFETQTYGGRVEGGYRLVTPVGGFTPYAALQALDFDQPGYSETGCCGGLGLAYAGRTASDIRSEIGARLEHVIAVRPDAALSLRARLAWTHDWVSDPRLGATFETLPGVGFSVEGAKPVKNAALVSGAAELRFAHGATIGAKVDAQLASGGSVYAGIFFVRLSW
jgi:outer membrane autotransporter protein